jgi:hypothetical protein
MWMGLQSTVIGHHIVLYIGTSILEICRHISTASRIVMSTIGVANITHLLEIKKCSHQDTLIKLGIRARLDWESDTELGIGARLDWERVTEFGVRARLDWERVTQNWVLGQGLTGRVRHRIEY